MRSTTISRIRLQDVTLSFDDVLSVANETDNQQQAAKTLGLNLGIARTYPLELVFYALVSPLGLGQGKRLSMEGFTLLEAEGQMQATEPLRAFTLTTLEAALGLLVQLGLLEFKESSRKYCFRARHYVSMLRADNGFAAIRAARVNWNRLGDQTEAVPRHVWTIPDNHLATLLNPDIPVCVACGLNGSGREFLAAVLARDADVVRTSSPFWQECLDKALDGPKGKHRVVVLDSGDNAHGRPRRDLDSQKRGKARTALDRGTKTAWELCGDLDTFLSVEPIGMGPLTTFETDSWAARRMGEPSSATPLDPSSPIPTRGRSSGRPAACYLFWNWYGDCIALTVCPILSRVKTLIARCRIWAEARRLPIERPRIWRSGFPPLCDKASTCCIESAAVPIPSGTSKSTGTWRRCAIWKPLSLVLGRSRNCEPPARGGIAIGFCPEFLANRAIWSYHTLQFWVSSFAIVFASQP